MSYEADTPVRAHHLANIAIDIGFTTRHRDEGHFRSHVFYLLPDDRGALVGVGTSRLPLSRHTCAETLWRFFDGLGPFGTNILESQRRWIEHEKQCTMTLATLLGNTADIVKHQITPDPDVIHEVRFTSGYTAVMWHQARSLTLSFCIYMCKSWLYLVAKQIPRPPGLDDNDWFQELRAKRCSRWIMRLDEQHKEAAQWKLRADRCDVAGQSHDVLWYCLRALFSLCPWYPTEWYMATWEAQMLPGVQIMIDVFFLMAKHFINVDEMELSKRADRQVMDHAFVSPAQDCEAYKMDTQHAIRHWRSTVATDPDESEVAEANARMAESTYARLVADPSAIDDIRRSYTKTLGGADFLPNSVLKWYQTFFTTTSDLFQDSQLVFARRTLEREKAEKACLKGWMAKYHTMTPFKYEVDEVLGELLDDAETITMGELLGMVVR